ncbi:MAG: hypothetical protein P3W90_003470 [Paracoccus sp. (in: a-proteobacteria)]|nr:hypothetical protein [Paracoccus sp. (in: a-proteobacteria)]
MAFIDSFQRLKFFLLDFTGLERDGLHMLLGSIVFALVYLILRRVRPALVAVLAVALALEVPDIAGDLIKHGRARWGASLHDIVTALLNPLIFVFILRFRR